MKKTIAVLIGFGLLAWVLPAQADMKEMKTYKEAFPEAKVKCIDCHADAMPKKDDGKHEMNDYGKAAVAEAQKAGAQARPTADTYKAVGSIESLKK